MAISERFDIPDMVNPVSTDLELMRDNWYWILASAANGSIVVPGWTTTMVSTSSPVDYSEPDSIQLSKLYTDVSPNITREIHIDLTWTGGNVTGMVMKYDDGTSSPSLETITGGTITLTYDGDGNFTGATSA